MYLSDSRKEFNSGIDFSAPENKSLIQTLNGIRFKKNEKTDVELKIKSLEEWIQVQALTASNSGELKTSEIYHNILNKILESNTQDKTRNIAALKKNINFLNNETQGYIKLGLISDPNYSLIDKIFNQDMTEKASMVFDILEPYVKAQKAKLKELESLRNILSLFIDSLNSYFSNKRIEYTVKTGFIIRQKITNDIIELNHLSSGEKQLLLLFCNIILASSKATVLLIDEPEISLNIKWQRTLLQTLLQFVPAKKHVQFIIATHSIELLTKHNSNVIPLKNTKDEVCGTTNR